MSPVKSQQPRSFIVTPSCCLTELITRLTFNIVLEKCYQIYIEYIMRIDVTGVSQSQCLQLISCGTYINIKRCTAEQFVLMSSINNQCFIMF